MKWLNFSNILDGTAKKLSAASGKEWGTSVAIASFFTWVIGNRNSRNKITYKHPTYRNDQQIILQIHAMC
jgi:hypothetical protein